MTSPYSVKTIFQMEMEEGAILKGLVSVPELAQGVIILSQLSSNLLHNDSITDLLNKNNLATIDVDLLTVEEFKDIDKRYNVELLSDRLNKIIIWTTENYPILADNIGLLGSGKAAAASLSVATGLNDHIKAIVCRSGRPDLVEDIIHLVKVPTLLVAGGLDPEVEECNHRSIRKMKSKVKLITILGASHLLSEYGKLNEFTLEMFDWFERELKITKENVLANS